MRVTSKWSYLKRRNKSFIHHFFPVTSIYSSSRKHSRKWARGAESYSDSKTLCLAQDLSPIKILWRTAHGVLWSFFGPFRTEYLGLRVKTMAWHGHSMWWRGNHGQMCPNVSKVLPDSVTLTFYELGDWWVWGGQRSEVKQLQEAWGKSHPEAKRILNWVIFFYRSPGMKKNIGTCGH